MVLDTWRGRNAPMPAQAVFVTFCFNQLVHILKILIVPIEILTF